MFCFLWALWKTKCFRFAVSEEGGISLGTFYIQIKKDKFIRKSTKMLRMSELRFIIKNTKIP